MHPTLRFGSTGNEVKNLQTRLNQRPSGLPHLAVDGIFGPKTLARVMEFQKQNGLVADGVVGPKTWAALDAAAPARKAALCGNGDAGNLGRVEMIRQQFVAAFSGAQRGAPSFALASFGSAGAGSGFGGSALSAFPKLPSFNPLAGFKPFAGTPQDTPTVRSRYGASINFATVFISDKTGLQNRPFTVGFALPFAVPGLPPVVQVMNLGPAPTDETVIHEMAHVWQSQHHSDPIQFMRNCVACQATAVAQNGLAAQNDPSLVLNKDFPGNFPFSAYAYRRGNPFGTYGGEQIAEQVEKNEAPIVAKIRSVTAGAVDADNVACLTNGLATEDLRASGVFI